MDHLMVLTKKQLLASLSSSVLFVGFGNICRSPMAEAIFKNMLAKISLEDKWRVDSAGVGTWYIGRDPDPRAIKILQLWKFPIQRKARQVNDEDFHRFDHILAMDDDDLRHLERMAPPSSTAKRGLLGAYDPLGEVFIEDPFYTRGEKPFQTIMNQCLRCCEGFLVSSVLKGSETVSVS
ncbi:unnamed protein product [Nezara viridula]|uniref:Low molecular weight phosphotyrosine protein phosphatase n=1 Tax=Nezara viridula TaxID=85310 RepID=A0A9P0HLI2_NEZVI|nr:unnamed protein product [Nezara viridula]